MRNLSVYVHLQIPCQSHAHSIISSSAHRYRYRYELLRHAQEMFLPLLHQHGTSGKPLLPPKDKELESNQILGGKLWVHWFFMSRCRPNAQHDLLSPGSVDLLTDYVLVGSKTSRFGKEPYSSSTVSSSTTSGSGSYTSASASAGSSTANTNGSSASSGSASSTGMAEEKSRLWAIEPDEVTRGKRPGRGGVLMGPAWVCNSFACNRGSSSHRHSHHSGYASSGPQLSVRRQPECPTCGTLRPQDWPVHPTWLAADATAIAWADLWRTCLEQHERAAARYLPSDGDWTDADTQCSAVQSYSS